MEIEKWIVIINSLLTAKSDAELHDIVLNNVDELENIAYFLAEMQKKLKYSEVYDDSLFNNNKRG